MGGLKTQTIRTFRRVTHAGKPTLVQKVNYSRRLQRRLDVQGQRCEGARLTNVYLWIRADGDGLY